MCPIVPTFTCGLLRSNFSFAMEFLYQLPSRRNSFAALQKPFPSARDCAIRIPLRRHELPGLIGAGPAAIFRVVLMKTPVDICRNPDVVFPSRNALKHVQKILQKSGAVDR